MENETTSGKNERFVTTGPAESGQCQVKVDLRHADSFIKFLLEKEVKLTPPEGGVIIQAKWQLEKEGKPVVHSFIADAPASEIEKLASEWEKFGLGTLPKRPMDS